MICVLDRLLKWLPNMLTLLRILLVCLLNIYIIDHFGRLLVPAIIFILIFATDLLDGRIARFYGNASNFGAVFDILADLFYVVSSYIVLYTFHVLPIWFLFVMLFKFIEFAVTSFFLKKPGSRESIFVFDFIGRVVAVLFYIIPILIYMSIQISQLLYYLSINVLIYIITLAAVISSLYRLWNCIKVCVTKDTDKYCPQ